MEFVVLAFSMTLERGYLLYKRYRILEVLGQGGMGSVYRALDENLGIEVAVKENLFTTEEYARQFRLEAVILANLRHPNLPRVTDHFVVSGQGQYLVMDFIEGEDLRQRMERQGTISDQEVILIGAAICDALTYLHTCRPPVIHRDLKPGNIRITPDGRIYLVDFGLAKIVRGTQATTTGARAMTPGYSPPEQYGTARTDPRTDIYSLGATLYAALTGVIPEDGLARAMDEVELTPICKHNPRVGRRLAAVIEKAMAIRPEDRFQTAEDFKRSLLEAGASKTQRLNGEIVVEPPPAAITNHLATSEEKTLEGASPENPLVLFPSTPISPPHPATSPPPGKWLLGVSVFLFVDSASRTGGALVILVAHCNGAGPGHDFTWPRAIARLLAEDSDPAHANHAHRHHSLLDANADDHAYSHRNPDAHPYPARRRLWANCVCFFARRLAANLLDERRWH